MSKLAEKNARSANGRGMTSQKNRPAQQQRHQPGRETEMRPRPESQARHYRAAGKLKGKIALMIANVAWRRGESLRGDFLCEERSFDRE